MDEEPFDNCVSVSDSSAIKEKYAIYLSQYYGTIVTRNRLRTELITTRFLALAFVIIASLLDLSRLAM
jgi:hypothetical protein